MKRLGFVLIILFFASSVYATELNLQEIPKAITTSNEIETPKSLLEDEDYKLKGRIEYDTNGVLFLDESNLPKLEVKVNVPKHYPKKSVLSDQNNLIKNEDIRRNNSMMKIEDYMISSQYGGLEFKDGSMTYGTTLGIDEDYGQFEYKSKLFARYDNDKIGIMTAIGRDAYSLTDVQRETIYFAPEIKLGHGLKVIDTIKAYPYSERTKNDISIQYSPKIKNSRDIVLFQAGVGQTYSAKSQEQTYNFSFSTKFRF